MSATTMEAHGLKRPLDEVQGFEGLHGGPPNKRHAPDERPEAVLRLLVPVRRVGSVIGKGGAIVKQIRENTGTRVRVVEPMPGSDDRVIVISGLEDPQLEFHGIQDALLQCHLKSVANEEGTVHTGQGSPPGFAARMLVCHTQAGCIIGKAGSVIKELKEATGAYLKVLPPDELPPCALANDRVIHMTGSVDALQHALRLVSKQIRENPPKEMPNPLPAASAVAGAAPPVPQPSRAPYRPAQLAGRGQQPYNTPTIFH